MYSRALVIAPHADDETVGCGGYIAKLLSSGCSVHVVVCTSMDEVRRTEFLRSCEELGGATGRALEVAPPSELRSAEPGLVQLLTQIIREIRPDVVLAPHKRDRHVDHEAAAVATAKACWRAGIREWPELGEKFVVAELLGYEIWSALPWEEVDVLVDVSAYRDFKRRAWDQYVSQSRRDIGGALDALNRYRGLITKTSESAEAYTRVRIEAERR